MPASIAATKTNALPTPAPSATRAGRGQKPASPHPMPKRRLPPTSLPSIVRPAGNAIGVPSQPDLRPLARANAIAPIATAPTITNASEGSQAPARSRKPRTFAGFAILDTRRPNPKMSPAMNELSAYMIASRPEKVPHNEHRNEARSHECHRSHD